MKLALKTGDVAIWRGEDAADSGEELFECGYGLSTRAGTNEAVMGQNGPLLEARSGVCLVIPIYVPRHRLGLIVNLSREEQLFLGEAKLISQPFEQFGQLKVAPIVCFVSSPSVRDEYLQQIAEARDEILSVAPTATFREILVGEAGNSAGWDERMGVAVFLDTATGRVTVEDDYGDRQQIDLTNE